LLQPACSTWLRLEPGQNNVVTVFEPTGGWQPGVARGTDEGQAIDAQMPGNAPVNQFRGVAACRQAKASCFPRKYPPPGAADRGLTAD
jgi:hypothetical protein